MTSQNHFKPGKETHQRQAQAVTEAIEQADGWIQTPEVAKRTAQLRSSTPAQSTVRAKLYYMRDHLREEHGVEIEKRPRSGENPGGDEAWYFRKDSEGEEVQSSE